MASRPRVTYYACWCPVGGCSKANKRLRKDRDFAVVKDALAWHLEAHLSEFPNFCGCVSRADVEDAMRMLAIDSIANSAHDIPRTGRERSACVIGPSLSQMSTYHKNHFTVQERQTILEHYDFRQWSESEQEDEEAPQEGVVPGVKDEVVEAAEHQHKRRKRDTGSASSRDDMGAIVAAAVSKGVAQGIRAAADAAKASAPLPALGPAAASLASMADFPSVGAAGGDVLVPRALLRELLDHCIRLEQSARHAGRLSAGFAQACEQETRVFAEIRAQLEARCLLRF